jgi:uncharacterized protein
MKTKLIVNLSRGRSVCVGQVADRPLSRMRGLIGRSGLPAGEGMLLRPAPAIHTAFMRFPIDALFLDRDLEVLEVVERLRPWRMASKRNARAVLELPAGESARRGVAVGDKLELRDRAHLGTEPGGHAASDAGELACGGAPLALDAPRERPARLRPLRILIISPDSRFRTVMSLLLSRRNCVVTTTANRGRALELAGREACDVALIDVDDATASARLRAALGALEPSIGIVLVSDDAAERPGADAHLAKWGPFDRLLDAVELANPRRCTGPGTR